MSKCGTTKNYDFSTVSGHYVFPKEFKISQASMDWDLKFTVYKPNNTAVVEEWTVANGKIVRTDAQTWTIPGHSETLASGEYTYAACYIIGGLERPAFRGTITVKNHI